jgi:CRP/FNR family transcriptional regulator, cyclic AMP receptor protein
MHDTRAVDDLLTASRWARGLSAEQLRRVRATTLVRRFQPGNFVCHRGDFSNFWIGVIDGLVKVTNLSKTGKSVTFATFPANSWFGEGSILKQELRKYDVVALRDSLVALMPTTTSSIHFNHFVITQLNERLGEFISAFEHDRLNDLDARVAHTIAAMMHPQLYPNRGGRIEITNEELSYIVGTTRQRVNHALQVLEKCGLIKVEYRVITVLNIVGLRDFARSA